MIDHVGLKVKDLARSVRFYEAALAPLGYVLCAHDSTSAGFGPKDAPALWLYASDTVTTTAHLALRASDRRAVDRFHAAGVDTGGRDHGAPGVRADYAPNYYAAFLLDPDGHNVEAVCME
ncbi:VOC family protein [Sandaracinus amylolyticus]|uniref:Lactoylglutathione lyase n=1 Tax=Sandaracinus amylolyticus TaxID=927083 RepID=A0A0F6VYP5_9BACT|nr:VOC family protein [Sandaracinus amylolyticus]AKF03000.1 Lactoylglutathione lyase [Sandaracinus amylolyticus]